VLPLVDDEVEGEVVDDGEVDDDVPALSVPRRSHPASAKVASARTAMGVVKDLFMGTPELLKKRRQRSVRG
jgi:hypothetical protein